MKTFVIFTLFVSFVCGDDDIFRTNQGYIKGSTLKSRSGREFKAFQGIPYARPPVGDLRFKDPEPAGSWDGVFNATTEPQVCLQNYAGLVGSEDCLYLNVYTPKIPNEYDEKLFPVIFWIPGGGFYAGSGGLSIYGPHYLLDKDVVVVSINYRLGFLGFFSTEDDVTPGNYGMKDQVSALEWVKRNIRKFGGNPNSVTIFGASAGGASIGLHLLSPMSKGLFHKAISDSGTPLFPLAVSPPGLAKQIASIVSDRYGCPTKSEELVKCLRKFTASELVDSIVYSYQDWRSLVSFLPVTEDCNDKKRSFLCNYPVLDFKQESYVPVLMGMNTGEGGVFTSRMYNATDLVDTELKDNFDAYAAVVLNYNLTTKPSDIPYIGKRIFERYYPDGTLENPLNTVKMFTEGSFLHGTFEMAIKLSSPVFYYVYDHLNYKSYNSLFGAYPYPRKLGVTHGDELISLFYTEIFGDLEGEDLEVSNLMVNLWTGFATNDEHTIDGTSDGQKWLTFDSEQMNYLLINSSSPVLSRNPGYEAYRFWECLPVLSGLQSEKMKP